VPVLALAALSAWFLWKRSPAGFLRSWFFIVLAPTSSFIPIVTEPAAMLMAHYGLAMEYKQIGDSESAKKELQVVQGLNPKLAEVLAGKLQK
jgi:hypothetical protein